jgi:hypothetical protein
MYLISRVNIGEVRERFLKEKNLRELVDLLNRIIESNQDGIIITAKDNILMYNRQTSTIIEDESMIN